MVLERVHDITMELIGPELIRGRDGRVFVLREFEIKDLLKVVSINRAVLPENYPEFFFVEHHRNFPRAFIVAELNGEVVGYMMNRVEFGWSYINRGKPARKGHVISIGVLPEARRIGVAYNMMIRGMRAMKHFYGAEEVYLEVRVSNTPAINLYKKLNYKIVDLIRGYYSDGEDAYIMARSLQDFQ
ncbi:GNAT family N-acetyltransferase [Vulcanisaeta thermophila]|uniref:GNAT family N-acetyltransferase n=1 Tax=Vulcanisaeta thermophila TaxID=867917 RepID=UPI000B2E4CFC|nr:GNAT family N-acetyltransferase [Vulcanisaeta thermophila]